MTLKDDRTDHQELGTHSPQLAPRILWRSATPWSRLPGWAILGPPPHTTGSPAPLRRLFNSLESLRAHGVRRELGALAWGGENSGRSVFLSRDFRCLLGTGPVDFWFCSEMRARVLCSALLLFSLPTSRQLCLPLSFLGASPPSVHWNRALQDPSGTTHPTISLSPAELNQSSWELTPTYPLNILRLSFMHENNIFGRDGANLRNPYLVLALVWRAQGEGSSILIPPTFISLRNACTDRRAGPGLGRGGMWAVWPVRLQGNQ